MPVVRIDDQGKEVQKKEEQERKKRAKRAGVIVLTGTVCSAAVFAQYSVDLGIFLAVCSTSLGSLLNLYAE